MKVLKIKPILLLLLSLHLSCAVQQSGAGRQSGYGQEGSSISLQVFYDELSPYGQWVDYPTYGYIWMPDVRQDFAPYSTDGYWVNTAYGWTWVSDYKWGWAPFHYGRWDYADYFGWFWVPDTVWGPSWVTWRSGSGYYGWSPMRPGMHLRDSFNDGYRDVNRWNFVRVSDFGRSDLHRHYVDRRQYNTIITNTTVINNTRDDRRRNTTYVAGPSPDDVQYNSGRRVNTVTVQEANRPLSQLRGNQLRIFRPEVDRTNRSGDRLAPSRVANLEEVKSARERNSNNNRTIVSPTEQNPRDRQRLDPGQDIQRRRLERQMQPENNPQQQQKSQPLQPQVTPVHRGSEMRQQQRDSRRQQKEQIRQPQQIESEQNQMQRSQPSQPRLTTPEQEGVPQRRR